jgi:Zeta toxin
MDQEFKLDEKKHEQIYRKIENDLFQETCPVLNPRIFITGGQPGSGKSKLLEETRKEFPDRNVVVINGDELRQYHPRSNEIFKLDDKRYSERTDADSRVWTKRIFDRAIETQRNIAFESTMRDAGPISDTMNRLRKEGYYLTTKVVATHVRMSETGILKRYEEQKADKGYGRFTHASSHDAGYEGMPKTVDYIEQNKLVDRLEVYNRDGNLLLDKELKAGEWNRQERAADVIEAERLREPTQRELDIMRADWQRIYDLMNDRKAPLKELEHARSVHQKIERELSKSRSVKRIRKT